jgi:hypothetical protein
MRSPSWLYMYIFKMDTMQRVNCSICTDGRAIPQEEEDEIHITHLH